MPGQDLGELKKQKMTYLIEMQAISPERQLSHLTELLTMFPNERTSPSGDANILATFLLPEYNPVI